MSREFTEEALTKISHDTSPRHHFKGHRRVVLNIAVRCLDRSVVLVFGAGAIFLEAELWGKFY